MLTLYLHMCTNLVTNLLLRVEFELIAYMSYVDQ